MGFTVDRQGARHELPSSNYNEPLGPDAQRDVQDTLRQFTAMHERLHPEEPKPPYVRELVESYAAHKQQIADHWNLRYPVTRVIDTDKPIYGSVFPAVDGMTPDGRFTVRVNYQFLREAAQFDPNIERSYTEGPLGWFRVQPGISRAGRYGGMGAEETMHLVHAKQGVLGQGGQAKEEEKTKHEVGKVGREVYFGYTDLGPGERSYDHRPTFGGSGVDSRWQVMVTRAVPEESRTVGWMPKGPFGKQEHQTFAVQYHGRVGGWSHPQYVTEAHAMAIVMGTFIPAWAVGMRGYDTLNHDTSRIRDMGQVNAERSAGIGQRYRSIGEINADRSGRSSGGSAVSRGGGSSYSDESQRATQAYNDAIGYADSASYSSAMDAIGDVDLSGSEGYNF